MGFVDAHAHYDVLEEKDLEGVSFILLNGMDEVSNRKFLSMTSKKVHVALGYHPLCVDSEEKALDEIAWIKTQKPKAIAEIGLDYFHEKDPEKIDVQKKVFIACLELAQEMKLPVLIHARNAVSDVLDIIEDMQTKQAFTQKFVMHCMEASVKNIDRAIAMGSYFTIPASVCRNEQFQRLLDVPLNKMLTETDAPYQGPVKGVPAKPQDVAVALDYIAKHKGLDANEVALIVLDTYMRLFMM
ncbi:MAG: TatD family hydrolase [Candidatus Woesearchaeota archaeon]